MCMMQLRVRRFGALYWCPPGCAFVWNTERRRFTTSKCSPFCARGHLRRIVVAQPPRLILLRLHIGDVSGGSRHRPQRRHGRMPCIRSSPACSAGSGSSGCRLCQIRRTCRVERQGTRLYMNLFMLDRGLGICGCLPQPCCEATPWIGPSLGILWPRREGSGPMRRLPATKGGRLT